MPGASLGFARLVLVGLGAEVDAEGLRRAAAVAGRATRADETVATTLASVDIEGAADLVVFGFNAGQYRFTRHRSDPKPAKTTDPDPWSAPARSGVASGRSSPRRWPALATWSTSRRRASHRPGWRSGRPTSSSRWGWRSRCGTSIASRPSGSAGWRRCRGARRSRPGWSGSTTVPAVARGKLAFVGKGIVFDSGGLSIKPADGMMAMKTDMAGAAAVFGRGGAIAAAEDPGGGRRPSPRSPRTCRVGRRATGDVFTARNGKTVEVLNTDAEGRLVLADGLSLAAEEEPDLIVDMATLTGACKVALGEKIAGLFASDDDTAARVQAAAAAAGRAACGDSRWSRNTGRKLDSTVADMKNIGDRYGGAITAALMLERFVGDVPWAHLDIAGPARSETDEHYITKGGTGFGVRTLVELAAQTADS